MPKAIGYLRVSSGKQVESGLGLEAQRAAVEGAAARLELPLAAVYTDEATSGVAGLEATESGGFELDWEERPELRRALDSLERGDVLIVAKRDRLARDVVLAFMLEQAVARLGAQIHAVDGGGNGSGLEAQLLRGLLSIFSWWERMVIRGRTREAAAAARRKGKRWGHVPYGYAADSAGRLMPKPAEMQTVVVMRQLRARGESYAGIGRRLAEECVKPPASAKSWGPSLVRYIVLRRDPVAQAIVATGGTTGGSSSSSSTVAEASSHQRTGSTGSDGAP